MKPLNALKTLFGGSGNRGIDILERAMTSADVSIPNIVQDAFLAIYPNENQMFWRIRKEYKPSTGGFLTWNEPLAIDSAAQAGPGFEGMTKAETNYTESEFSLPYRTYRSGNYHITLEALLASKDRPDTLLQRSVQAGINALINDIEDDIASGTGALNTISGLATQVTNTLALGGAAFTMAYWDQCKVDVRNQYRITACVCEDALHRRLNGLVTRQLNAEEKRLSSYIEAIDGIAIISPSTYAPGAPECWFVDESLISLKYDTLAAPYTDPAGNIFWIQLTPHSEGGIVVQVLCYICMQVEYGSVGHTEVDTFLNA